EPTKYWPRIHRKPTANDVANKIKNTPTMVNSGQERRPVGTASSSSSAGGGVLVGCAASDAPCSKAAARFCDDERVTTGIWSVSVANSAAPTNKCGRDARSARSNDAETVSPLWAAVTSRADSVNSSVFGS